MKRLIAYLAVACVLITLAGCRSGLVNAIVNGNIAAVQTQISAGADVNEKNPDNFSPLHWAADNGRLEIVRLLIDKGAAVNLRSERYGTPLTVATYQGHTEVVRLLLEKGADPALTDAYGKTALNYAEEYQFAEIARILRESSPSPGKRAYAGEGSPASGPAPARAGRVAPADEGSPAGSPAPTRVGRVAPAGEGSPASSPAPAIAAPGAAVRGSSRTISMAVFTFESANVDASPYAMEIVNILATRLKTIPGVELLGRRDLEMFLAANDLQQNNNLGNVIEIGSRLGLSHIVSGRVERKDALITADCRLISIAERKAILSRAIRAFGSVNLQQEVVKFGDAVADALSR